MDRINRDQDVFAPNQLHIPSRTSSPMSSAPTTPRLQTPRRTSQPAVSSPLQHVASSRQQQQPPVLRRTSSAMSVGTQRPGSRAGTPKVLERKPSRSSLGGEEKNDKRPTPKRSISNLISSLREAQSSMESIQEPVALTAPQIAIEHFTRQLIAHGSPIATAADTVVILHDACYGHRFSRLKTSKGALSMIVERPERIHASVLGASTAYVRLGGYHSGARNAPHPDKHPNDAPPFHIRKSARTMDITSSYVTSVHGTEWMTELKEMCVAANERLAAGSKELERSTGSKKQQLHEGDLYLAAESLDAFQGALGGVADAVDAIFQPASVTSRAFVAVRPPGHHCSADHPSGFCWLNNVHVGIEYAAQMYGLTHAAIIDFDLHHGDGSQSITWERNSRNNQKRINAKPNSKLKLGPEIGYYSLHDINSYPCEYGDDEKVQAASLCIDNAHSQSVWNVHLQPWKTEEEFWMLYETQYRVLIDKARTFLDYHTKNLRAEGKVQPKAAIFISAGFDASEWESPGMQRHKVNVPTEFYARFTRDIVDLAQDESTGCGGKVVSVLEGGYSDRALCSGVFSHLSGLCAADVTSIPAKVSEKPAVALDQMMRGLHIRGGPNLTAFTYNKTWWSAENLTALENKVNPPPPTQGKKVRTGPQPTYATPTESFAYKVVDTNKFAQSISGTMREGSMPTRPATPPPPEVDWVVATQELSNILIPTDKPTKSFTAEELAPIRTKNERASMMPMIPTDGTAKSRQLRTRNAKAPAYQESAHSDELDSVRSHSQASNRRQTLHDIPMTPAPAFPRNETQQRRMSRRLSAGSRSAGLSTFANLDATSVLLSQPNTLQGADRSMQPPPVPAVSGLQISKPKAPSHIRRPPSAGPSSATVSHSSARTNTKIFQVGHHAGTGAKAVDVDTLTTGMKKVTLKVGSRDEHDRKQKEKLEKEATDRRARALKGAETRRLNAAAKKAAATKNGVLTKEPTTGVQPMTVPSANAHIPAVVNQGPPLTALFVDSTAADPFVIPSQPTSAQMHTMSYPPGRPPLMTQPMPDFVSASITASPPIAHSGSIPMPIPQPSEAGPVQIVSQAVQPSPSGGFPDSAGRQLLQEYALANGMKPLQNAARPSLAGDLPCAATSDIDLPNGTKTALPAWSSTGVIPFASAVTQQAPAPAAGSSAGPIHGTSDAAKASDVASSSVGHYPMPIQQQVTKQEATGLETNIWDVPDTPTR